MALQFGIWSPVCGGWLRLRTRGRSDPRGLLEHAALADGLGYDIYYIPEHYLNAVHGPSHDVAEAWIRGRSNKTAALALAWAREQVRLSLQEIIEAMPRNKRGRIEAMPDTLAWVLLAGCEAIAHEPPSAVADRVRALLELSGHAAPTD